MQVLNLKISEEPADDGTDFFAAVGPGDDTAMNGIRHGFGSHKKF
jgi:hypothetical protein